MCDSCGCALTGDAAPGAHRHTITLTQRVDNLPVLNHLLAQNDRVAIHNREHLDAHRVFAVNLMSSPGAGKTTLLETTIRALHGEFRMAVIEGDLATENDARRIRAQGVPAVQITTGNACHLDAEMVHKALHEVSLSDIDVLFIENVGNLVCPASFDLGAHSSVALLSVPEGDDKPEKYPVMFRAVDLVLLTKTDLLAHIPEFSVERAQYSLHSIGCAAPLLPISSRRAVDIEGWCNWLCEAVATHAQHANVRERARHVREHVDSLSRRNMLRAFDEGDAHG